MPSTVTDMQYTYSGGFRGAVAIGVFEGAKRGLAPPKIFNDAVTRKQVVSRSRDCIYCTEYSQGCQQGGTTGAFCPEPHSVRGPRGSNALVWRSRPFYAAPSFYFSGGRRIKGSATPD